MEAWIVQTGDDWYGPLESEDACYAFAAKVSREPNDWMPIRLTDPATVTQEGEA
mgnify:CR=1 FL=1